MDNKEQQLKPNTLETVILNPDVKPQDDFFDHVNGPWIKANPIPSDESRWGSFNILNIQVEAQLKALLEGLAEKTDSGLSGNAQKIKAFYRMAMDVERANRLGLEPLEYFYKRIDALQNLDDASILLGELHRSGIGAWWGLSVEQDMKQSELMALYFSQDGLGLPDRDYYLKDDEASKAIRAKYLAYIASILKLMGVDEHGVTHMPLIVMGIETELANASMTRVESRDVEKLYNKMSFEEFAALTPNVSWKSYAKGMKHGLPGQVIVCQPEFFKAVNKILGALPIEDVKTYLKWHVTRSMSAYLTEALEKEAFDFYGKTFGGATEMKSRSRRVLGVVDAMLGEALGQLYVEKHFSPQAKDKINALVDRLMLAYRARIERLDWMSSETKEKALHKLSTVTRKLGYPDKWKTWDGLYVGNDSYAANYIRANVFEFDRQADKIGKPVDRTEWRMSPQTINACYDATMNEILFPAGILQPPFFDPNADDAVNFGGIGGVIGHELTHGFDDQGSRFDEKGNLFEWWTEEDKKKFDAKTAHLASQFDAYKPFPDAQVNGKLTLGENIADLGGLLIAYDGLQLTLKEKPQPDINGFSQTQRLFLNWAIVWCSYAREELARLFLQVDPHSPPYFRVNGPLSNLEEFYEAFDVKEGDKLWRPPEDRVKVW
ncbi:MAG: M13 family metallopeptidase [bacterium]|nr:M13 family metallopeptidase [bacterium]